MEIGRTSIDPDGDSYKTIRTFQMRSLTVYRYQAEVAFAALTLLALMIGFWSIGLVHWP